ncbi:hypothetical protein Lepto7376_0127 [[Leptolyngbya] sp. PCC 7376]|uniref:hypothetical protein n=1 Tax=[Leptolyngbya] sp. PCC 7376 TaxID=111781 RepID=UPI00029EE253|nr:hypothetical protein [[Leptolyngbya] sp. PCC 7376]AFY36575.1 hypothetical protein Lepto7376_0127 [[Leptolyngbya] sp. PCC 7376]
MKFQTTLAFTLLLLVAMVGAGTVSALYGFTIGYDALQGVRQPEGNPTQQLIRSRKSSKEHASVNGIELVSEREVIVEVYDKIYAREQGLKKDNAANSAQTDSNFVKTIEKEGTPTPEAQAETVFPLTSTAQNIQFDVIDSRLLGNYWVLDISLQNNSNSAVRFLYNFLELKDGQGRLVSGQTEGLPAEIPANNQSYTGQVRIPAVILEDVETISMNLSDYPNQEITLEIADIPVVR